MTANNKRVTMFSPEAWEALNRVREKERKAFWLLLGVNLIVWSRVGLVLLEMVK